jgi:phosphoglycerate kinase
MKKLTIDDLELNGKRVLVRVDFNVPLDENRKVTDATRIVETLPTLKKIIESNGRLIVMSHLGRPKGKPKPEFSLRPVAEKLQELIGRAVQFANDCIGKEVEDQAAKLQNGDILLLENLRFHEEEEKNDPDFAAKLARLGEIYVNDAFGSAHRAHASTEGVTKHFQQCAAGYLMQKELAYLGQAVGKPERPYVAILGGAKISGKIDVISNLLDKVDALLIGGGMAYTFFKAEGKEIGTSLLEEDKIDLAKEIIQKAAEKNVKMLFPVDCVIADKFDKDAASEIVDAGAIKPDWMALDIGPKTIELFTNELLNAKTVVWNGPMGVFEMDKFANGTNEIAKILTETTKKGAVTIIGGGDSAAAIAKLGLEKEVSHVSTGGGASLEFLEGKELPGVAALTDKE